MQIPNGALTALWATPLFRSDGIAISSGASGTDTPLRVGTSFDAEILLLESGEVPAPSAPSTMQSKSATQDEAAPATFDKGRETAPVLRQPAPQEPSAQPRPNAEAAPIRPDAAPVPASPERVSQDDGGESKLATPAEPQAGPQQPAPAFWNDAPPQPPIRNEAPIVTEQAPKPAHAAARPKSDFMFAAAAERPSPNGETGGSPAEATNRPEKINPPDAPQPPETLRRLTARPVERRTEAAKPDINPAGKPEVPATKDMRPVQTITAQPVSDPQVDSKGGMQAEPPQRFDIHTAEKPTEGRTAQETTAKADLGPPADATGTAPAEGAHAPDADPQAVLPVAQTPAQPERENGPLAATPASPRAVVSSPPQNPAQPRPETLDAPVEGTFAQKPSEAATIAPASATPVSTPSPSVQQSTEEKAVDMAPVRKAEIADPAQGGAPARLTSERRVPLPEARPEQKTDPVVGTDSPKPAELVQPRQTPASATNTIPTSQANELKVTPYRATSPAQIVETEATGVTDLTGLVEPGRPVTSAQTAPALISGHAPLLSHGAELHAVRSQILASIQQSAMPDGPPRTEITLAPEELGKVHIHFTGQDDSLQVRLFVERPETLDLLRRQADLLAQELRQSGLSHASLSFGDWRQQEQRPDARNALAKAHGFTTATAEPAASHAPRLIEAGRLHLRL